MLAKFVGSAMPLSQSGEVLPLFDSDGEAEPHRSAIEAKPRVDYHQFVAVFFSTPDSCSAKNLSASMAAIQPVPAAVTAWR